MRKLFASDFDGTIHFGGTGEVVPARDLAAIRAYQEAGGLFGVCTGRPLLALTAQTGTSVPFDFYIATTGAAIFDRDLACLWRKDVPADAVREALALTAPFASDPNLVFVVASDTYWARESDANWHGIRVARTFDEVEGPFAGMGMETVTVAEAEEAAALVNERLKGTLEAYVNLASIDVVPTGCSKGDGLRRAAELFGAELTAGIGDSFNDLPLLEAADVAYTFHRADPAMHGAADLLVDSAAEALADFQAR